MQITGPRNSSQSRDVSRYRTRTDWNPNSDFDWECPKPPALITCTDDGEYRSEFWRANILSFRCF